MKMKFKCGLLALLLLGSSTMIYAGNGIKRSEWDFRPEITTGNFVYFFPVFCANLFLGYKLTNTDLSDNPSAESLPWWYPQIGWRSTFISDITYGGHRYGDTKENVFDWTDPGFSIGYAVNFTSKQVPFGFRAKLAYDHENFKARDYKEKGPWTSFSKDMIVPEAALKILFGKYRTSEQMYILSLGARYDYAFNAKGPFDSKDAVNNGVSGIIGFEFASPAQHIQMGGNYVIPFYDYFNKDYSPDGGITRPFENAKTSLLTVLEVYMRFGF